MGRKRKVALVGSAAFQQQLVPPALTEDERHRLASAAGVSFSVDDWTEIDRIRLTYVIYRRGEILGLPYTMHARRDGVQNRIARLSVALREHNASSALRHLSDDDVGQAVWDWLNSVCGRRYDRLLDSKTVFAILNDPEHRERLSLMDGLLGLATLASEEMRRAHDWAFDGLKVKHWPAGADGEAVVQTAWNFFVNSLAAVARKHGIAVTASKHSSRLKPEQKYKLSRFCRFVEKIRGTMPDDVWEHRQSDAAFALAVDRALGLRQNSATVV